MDKDRENIIDDMFEYYEETDLGDTQIINSQEDLLGATQVVNTQENEFSGSNDSSYIEETMQVEVPVTRRVPAEEILGNMDREGRIIEPEPQTYTRRVRTTYEDMDVPYMPRKAEYHPPTSRPTSLWFKLKPLWVTIMACVVLAGAFKFYMTDTGIIGTYKRNFSYNMSLILRTFGIEIDTNKNIADEIEEFEEYIGASNPVSDFFTATGLSVTAYAAGDDTRPRYDDNYTKKAAIPFPGAGDSMFCEYDDGVVCAKANYICYITKNGQLKWEYTTAISQPILSVAGDYVALAGEDSTHFVLYKKGKEVFTAEAEDNIKSCSVSPKGDIALVTDKTAYKGAVCVYNSKGEEVFSWISGVNYITSATVTKNRCVSVSLVSTEEDITSYIMIFDIYSTDPIGGSEFSNTLIYDTSAHKNTTLGYGDNSISGVNSNGETKYNVLFDTMAITHTAEDPNGYRAVSYTDNHLPYINVYNAKGRLRNSVSTEVSPEFLDLYKSTILYNNGRDIICGRANDGRKTKYSAPMTIKKLVMLNKNTYMVAYENSLEFIKI